MQETKQNAMQVVRLIDHIRGLTRKKNTREAGKFWKPVKLLFRATKENQSVEWCEKSLEN